MTTHRQDQLHDVEDDQLSASGEDAQSWSGSEDKSTTIARKVFALNLACSLIRCILTTYKRDARLLTDAGYRRLIGAHYWAPGARFNVSVTCETVTFSNLPFLCFNLFLLIN